MDDVTRGGGRVTLTFKLLLIVLGLADRIGFLSVSSLCPQPLRLSQEPPASKPALKLPDSFGAGVLLCRTLQRSFVKHCPALWLDSLRAAF